MSRLEDKYPEIMLSGTKQMPFRYRSSDRTSLGIIIHSMTQRIMYENQDLHAPDFLTAIGLSAHCFIEPDGTRLQGVPTDRVALHAGKSSIDGHSGLNGRWLGIEVLVEGQHDWAGFRDQIMSGDPFTEDQYRSAAIQCRKWMAQYPTIRKDYIVGHSDVSGPHVRSDPKIDPGKAWDWDRFWRWFNLATEIIDPAEIESRNLNP